MKSNKLIPVELRLADSTTTKHVTLRLNQSDELPVVLVDPLDDNGTVIAGMWLNRDTQESVYHWTKQTPPSRRKKNGLVYESESNLMSTK